MKHYLNTFLIFLLLPIMTFASDTALYPFTNAIDAKRFQNMLEEVRCVVCQNQSIADSSAPLAKDLREKIYSLVQQQLSDEEIKQYLRNRYGDFILLRPRFMSSTMVLWLFPILSLLFISVLSVYYLTKRVKYVRIKQDKNTINNTNIA